MFLRFLWQLRARGLPVDTSSWLGFLDALTHGLAIDLDSMYHLGRAVLCRTEADFDAYDVAFAETFADLAADEALRGKLQQWLEDAIEKASHEVVDPGMTDAELWEQLLDRLRTQKERHDGGNRWVGTGGTSPFGHSGRASRGIRVGGHSSSRSAIAVASERRWAGYSKDKVLDTRDMEVALRALRKLTREGQYELDLDATIERTAQEGGDIMLEERRARENQVRVVLMLDAGGSMQPHADRVDRLFSAAARIRAFRSLDVYTFHNCVYGTLWRDAHDGERLPTHDVIQGLTARHRVIFVGDASMAPYELFGAMGYGWSDEARLPGLEWLRLIRKAAPHSVWLNPDPQRWWEHPTVSAIGAVFPMFPLTVDGLRRAVKKLRAPS